MKYEKITSFVKWSLFATITFLALYIGDASNKDLGWFLFLAGCALVYKVSEAVPEILEMMKRPEEIKDKNTPVFNGKSVVVILLSGEVMKGTMIGELNGTDEFLYLKEASATEEKDVEVEENAGGVKTETGMTTYDHMALPYNNIAHVRLENLES